MNQLDYLRASLRRDVQTVAYLAVLVLLLMVSAWLIMGGLGVLLMGLVTMFALAASRRLPVQVLMRMRRGRPLAWGEAHFIPRMVQQLARRAGLNAPPTLYLIESPEMQAFAVDSDGATAIGITPNLVRQLSANELEGVLAHELSHLAGADTKLMSVATAMHSLTRSLASMTWLLLLFDLLGVGSFHVSLAGALVLLSAPTLGFLAEQALSRTREFSADLNAARLTGRPEALATALLKLDYQQRSLLARLVRGGAAVPIPEALRTHPRTEERVQRLLELSRPQKRLKTAVAGHAPRGASWLGNAFAHER